MTLTIPPLSGAVDHDDAETLIGTLAPTGGVAPYAVVAIGAGGIAVGALAGPVSVFAGSGRVGLGVSGALASPPCALAGAGRVGLGVAGALASPPCAAVTLLFADDPRWWDGAAWGDAAAWIEAPEVEASIAAYALERLQRGLWPSPAPVGAFWTDGAAWGDVAAWRDDGGGAAVTAQHLASDL